MIKTFGSKKEKVLAAVFAFLLLFLCVDNWIIGPMATNLKSLNASVENAEQQLDKDRAIVARRDIIQAQFNRLAPDGASGRGGTGSDWLRDIEKAAMGSVVIRNITPLPGETRQSFMLEKVEIVCKGNLADLTKLIYDIQRGPRHPYVRRMRLKATDDPAGLLDCYLEISRSILK